MKTKTIKQFIIFKEGVTERPVTIVSLLNQPFDKEAKIKKYEYLGYKVTLI